MKYLIGLLNDVVLMRWLAVAWTVVMLLGCLTPHQELPNTLLTLSDKAMHVAIFVLFTFLWQRAGYSMLSVLIIGMFFGAFIEVMQYVLPINRSADWLDLLADGIGTVLGVLLAWLVVRVIIALGFTAR
ncbi:VanZ family protein [Spirosoma sp. BT702]|uniref:VanZ family protein n=1 Tax=Spirosoma profusum TaxID=2771354 RepID=A0A926XVY0_9BACT|nr:VanZ family protein [Spirosoma profusum]MBD2700945.1 VanZ family protein [Spirosoma profusum]